MLSPEQKREFYQVIRNEFEKGGLGVHGEKGATKHRLNSTEQMPGIALKT